MAQLSWTYVSNTGRQFNVGLFHGPNTGHLLVHCNLKVVIIDFSVLETKTYPLFLDDELCELTVERKGNQFYYGFDINREADTPRNRHRKTVEKKHWRQTLLFFGAMAVCIALFTGFFLRLDARQKEDKHSVLLAKNGAETIARIEQLSAEGTSTLIHYSFIANGQSQEAEMEYPGEQPIILNHGMPLQAGDEFRVRFARNNPGIKDLHLDQPTEGQVETYRKLALQRHETLHPNLTHQQAECLLGLAYELKGVPGLADFYFQDASPEHNAVANELTYKRLVRGLPFQQRREQECW